MTRSQCSGIVCGTVVVVVGHLATLQMSTALATRSMSSVDTRKINKQNLTSEPPTLVLTKDQIPSSSNYQTVRKVYFIVFTAMFDQLASCHFILEID